LHFPSTTVYGRRIPKEIFCKQSSKPTEMKDWLMAEVESIVFAYKLTANTINVGKGEMVEEIDVFVVTAKGERYSAQRFESIDSLLPRHNIFIVFHGGHTDVIAFYKELQGEKWSKGRMELLTDVDLSHVPLRIEGLSLDDVYLNLLRGISNSTATTIAGYKEDKAQSDERQKLEKKIATLTNKMRRAVEPRRKLELFNEIRDIEKKMR